MNNEQIAPAVKYGGKHDILRASIIPHPTFNDFKIYTFTRNLRLQRDDSNEASFSEYADTLLEVGYGALFLVPTASKNSMSVRDFQHK